MTDNTASSDSWLSTTFSPLSNSIFRNVWIAGAASNMGGIIQATAAAWFMTTLTSSPTLIALVQTAATAPMVIFALASGTSADLFDKRKQMLFANLISLVGVILLVVLAWQDAMSPITLLLLTGLMSVGAIAFMPAWHASVIEIVSRPKLAASISLNNLAFNLARAIGPAIAVEIIAVAGVMVAFGVNGFAFLLMIGAVLTMRHRSEPKTLPPESIGRAMIDGLRYVALSPGLRVHIARAFILTFFAAAILALPPVIAIDLELGTRGFGLLLTSFGAGAVAGALTVAWFRTRLAPSRQLALAMTLLGVMSICVGLSNSLLLASASLFLGGLAWTQAAATLQVSIQTGCPRWVTARTISIFSTMFALGIASGSAFWGVVASQTGPFLAMIVAGSGMLASALFSTLVHYHDPAEEDLQPRIDLAAANLPEVDPRSGPVWLTVEYRVTRQNAAAFRAAIRDYARIRRRDGARNWAVAQDLEDHEIWIERFQSPTWSDYLHRISRTVVADKTILDRISNLTEGPPKWRRQLERSGTARDLSGTLPDDDETVPINSSMI